MLLNEALIKAKKYIPSYWPLQSFIATNPLFELNENNFLSTLENLSQNIKIHGTLSLSNYHNYYAKGKISHSAIKYAVLEMLNDNNLSIEDTAIKLKHALLNQEFQKLIESLDYDQSIDNILLSHSIETMDDYNESNKINVAISKFIADFIDLGQAKWKMPVRSNNLYQAWIEYNLNVGDKVIKSIISEISQTDSEMALNVLVEKLSIPTDLLEKYIIQISFKILGWLSLVKWLEERPDNPYVKVTAQVTDIYAIWLILELALLLRNDISPCYINTLNTKNNVLSNLLQKFDLENKFIQKITFYHIKLIWQRALEREYQTQLITKINNNSNKKNSSNPTNAQFVFCIDTRSEGIRRKIEFVGNYQTFGFAGFFGIGFKFEDKHNGCTSLQCPVIVKPEKILHNRAQIKNKSIKNSIYSLFDKSKSGFISPLIIFDVIGLYFSLSLFIKTLLPNKIKGLFTKKENLVLSNNNIDIFEKNSGFDKEELAEKLSFVLKSIGLVKEFSPFVIISGHIAESENNPFNSSLDCGACGGNGGIPNAIAFCQAVNSNDVRLILKQNYDITIPEDTVFISACHNTTTDNFDFYNLDQLNENKKLIFSKIINDLTTASNLLREERLLNLTGDTNLDIRKNNWAELVPEMALANNAAFIIGPRWLTQNINLNRRTFLHSYEPDLDENGDILNFIFNAPVLVGHWINSQYYFSTTDPEIYGAGNKAIHNVVSRIGVMEGNFSDLKIWLPQQSIMFGDKLMHEPLRLTVFVYAKKEIIVNIIKKSPILKNLIDGRWMHLEILDVA